LYLQPTLRVVWSPRGQTPVVNLHPGRQLTYFYGALNLLSGQQVAMQSSTMKPETSALFLHKPPATFPHVPLVTLWDRTPGIVVHR
jgi:hypothetical protein